MLTQVLVVLSFASVIGSKRCNGDDTCGSVFDEIDQSGLQGRRALLQTQRTKVAAAFFDDDLHEGISEIEESMLQSSEDVNLQRVNEVALTEEGFLQITQECCMLSFDFYSRRVIGDMGLEICDEGCFNGFIPFFFCGLSQTLKNYTEHIVIKSQEECSCFAPVGQCQDGGMPLNCENTGHWDPSAHRRRICNTPTAPPALTSAPATIAPAPVTAIPATTAAPATLPPTNAPTTEAVQETTTPAASTTLSPPAPTPAPTTTTVATTTYSANPQSTPQCKDSPWTVDEAYKYTLITEGDATIHAHSVYTGMAVGGTLYDGTPQTSGVVKGPVVYQQMSAGNWNFNQGFSQGALPFDWTVFEWLAQNMVDYSNGGFRVKIFTRGGTYSMDDVLWDGQGDDNGKTLMVFNTHDDINLKQTSGGRQFGPSVLAPFSTVTLQGDAGYLDGCVIAKKFGPSDLAPFVRNPDALQMHGDCYTGAIQCRS